MFHIEVQISSMIAIVSDECDYRAQKGFVSPLTEGNNERSRKEPIIYHGECVY